METKPRPLDLPLSLDPPMLLGLWQSAQKDIHVKESSLLSVASSGYFTDATITSALQN